MIRENEFKLHQRPYAVGLGSLDTSEVDNGSSVRATMRAVWFRRSGGVGRRRLNATLGLLWDYMPLPADVAQFMDRLDDGRHNVSTLARWDGSELWAPDATEKMRQGFRDILQPALEGFPAVPAGFDGWWRSPRR